MPPDLVKQYERAIAKRKAEENAERTREGRKGRRRYLRRLRRRPCIRVTEDDLGRRLVYPPPRWLYWALAAEAGAILALFGLTHGRFDAPMAVVFGSMAFFFTILTVFGRGGPVTICALWDGRVIVLGWTRRVLGAGRVEDQAIRISEDDETGLGIVRWHGAASLTFAGLGDADLDQVREFCRTVGVDASGTRFK